MRVIYYNKHTVTVKYVKKRYARRVFIGKKKNKIVAEITILYYVKIDTI